MPTNTEIADVLADIANEFINVDFTHNPPACAESVEGEPHLDGLLGDAVRQHAEALQQQAERPHRIVIIRGRPYKASLFLDLYS